MGSFMVVNGTVQVRECAEITRIINQLRGLAEGLEEQDVIGEPVEDSLTEVATLEIGINLLGYASGSTSSAIEAKIEELGVYATEGVKFTTEWEGQAGYFFVGDKEQIALAESAYALRSIREHIFTLRGEDIIAAVQYILQDAKLPPRKHDYLNSSESICPFYQREESLKIHFLHTEGHLARSRVQCEVCQYTWQGHYILMDMTQVRDDSGKVVNDDGAE